MRLASKIFLTSALVVVVLAVVGVLSLRAVGRLAENGVPRGDQRVAAQDQAAGMLPRAGLRLAQRKGPCL